MINQILGKIGLNLGLGDGSLNEQQDSRRRAIRHPGMQAEIVLADRAYSVRDWSLRGVYFESQPDMGMDAGDKVNFTIRFRFPNETVTIQQMGRVVRSAKRGIAAEFAPLSNDVRRKFERVIDSYNAQEFLESQFA